MKITIRHAEMDRNEDGDYIGKVQFEVEHHKEPYEIVFFKQAGKDWGYSLHFLNQSGPEEEIDALDRYLEEEDDAYEQLLSAVERLIPS